METPLSRGGVVSLLYYPVLFSGANTFVDNNGPSIRVRINNKLSVFLICGLGDRDHYGCEWFN